MSGGTFIDFGGSSSFSGGTEQAGYLAQETVIVAFKEGSSLYDPDSTYFQVLSNNIPIAINTTSSLIDAQTYKYSLTRVSTGVYRAVIYITMPLGLYDINFVGTKAGAVVPVMTIKGQIVVGAATRIQDLVARVRHRLMDMDPSLYTLISDSVNVWKDESLTLYLQDTLDEINMRPVPTAYDFSSFPYVNILVVGAMYKAVHAAAVLEVWNRLSYTDELSLNIDRASLFQSIAKDLEASFNKKVEDWKAWLSLYGDEGSGTGVGLGSSTLPFQISRILSFLPNMKAVWGL